MKKLSKIFLTIGGVFHIVGGVSTIISATVLLSLCIIFLVTGNLYGASIFINAAEESAEASAEAITWTFNVVAIVYLWVGLLLVALGILSFVAAKLTFRATEAKDTKSLIAPLVFAVLLDVKIAIVGCIFGLITLMKEENKKPDDDPVADEVIR